MDTENIRKSYSSNYLKIYFWQGISIVLNLLAMFIVIPKLSGSPAIYGIYTLCISVSIYLSYADIGFVGAGYKYAAESFAKKDIVREIKIIGFVSYILILFILLYSFIIIGLSFNPIILISNLSDNIQTITASRLLIILGLFSPINVLQRVIQIIFGIRLEDYIYQRINILFSCLKITSVFYFFSSNRYDIVGYFLFFQITSLLSAIVSLYLIRKRYNYNFKLLFHSLRFSKEIYSSTKKLALSSFFVTILWILFYEMDTLIIAKFLGIEMVAIYAIGFSLISFLRTILGVFFTPFSARFNHFKGLNDTEGLQNIVMKVISLSLPLVIYPILSLVILSKSFVYSWVGEKYSDSIHIVNFLCLCNLFASFSYPGSFLFIVREKIKAIYLINIFILVIYWVGILVFFQFLGLDSFAIFKFISFTFAAIFYIKSIVKFLEVDLMRFLKTTLIPHMLPSISIIALGIIIREYLPMEKDPFNLVLVIATGGVLCIIALILSYFSSSFLRSTINLYFKKSKLK